MWRLSTTAVEETLEWQPERRQAASSTSAKGFEEYVRVMYLTTWVEA